MKQMGFFKDSSWFQPPGFEVFSASSAYEQLETTLCGLLI